MEGEHESRAGSPVDTSPAKIGKGQRIYVQMAWASLLAGIIISLVLWLWIEFHEGSRGQRPTGVLVFYIVLFLGNAAGVVAGLVGLILGTRSWREALLIIPPAVLGMASTAAPPASGCWALRSRAEIWGDNYNAPRAGYRCPQSCDRAGPGSRPFSPPSGGSSCHHRRYHRFVRSF